MEARRAERLYTRAEAGRWKVPLEVLTNALERSAEKAFGGRAPSEAELARAERIIEEFRKAEAEGLASMRVGEDFVDYAIVKQAERTLAARDAMAAAGQH